MSWISKEVRAAEEAHIRAVMKALDRVLEEPIGDDWNNHLRKLAIAAIEAGAV